MNKNMTSHSNSNAASPINNLLFDFISILHSKAEGLAACEKYLEDATQQQSEPCVQLLNRIIEQDRRMVMEVKDHLEEMFSHKEMYEGGNEGASARM